jgi:hypothetical protein
MNKKLLSAFILTILLGLSACAASSSSPVGVNCDYSQEKPLWEMNPDCQGGR